jgi:DNA-nicking Smr family endonuclease
LPSGVAAEPKPGVERGPPFAACERRSKPMEEPRGGAVRQKPLAPFDQRRARRIATGRLAIDARLDLHGLHQSTARAELRAFIRDCYERDCRTVLVITGKGSTSEADRPFELDGPDRGVLRRNVPLWLSEPEMREMVVSFAAAHSRHGGEGALYVQLRRRNRHRV